MDKAVGNHRELPAGDTGRLGIEHGRKDLVVSLRTDSFTGLDRSISPLANEFVTVMESPDPDRLYCYSPGLARCPGGRLVATLDQGGPAVKDLPGPKFLRGEAGWSWQGKVFTSDDRGRTWKHRNDFPFLHARPFVAGRSLYVLGQAADLCIIRSDDWGETWSPVTCLTTGQYWHQAPSNVHYAHGNVYLVMERRVRFDVTGWHVSEMAPVLMRASVNSDLTRRTSWTFATELCFRDVVPENSLDLFGVPFYSGSPDAGVDLGDGRIFYPIGWLETNVVQFMDPDHIWFDPDNRTFHLWMRAHTGCTGYAAIARVVEQADGTMQTMPVTAPSGRKMVYVPCPGGQMKFHVLYDEVSKLYWLLSTQSTDSMTRIDRLSRDRFNLPDNERCRMQLHFSKNMIDWCFAGLVAVGPVEKASRNYASMVIDGDDFHVLSRSGDERAHDPHNTNLITFHTVTNFRSLPY